MLLCGFCMLFYLALTGFHASTIRAVLLVFSVYLAFLFWEEPDPITALGAILYLSLLTFPYAIFDLSLWMSYLATFGILVFSPLVTSLSNSLREHLPSFLGRALAWVLGLLLVGCAANGALLLLMACVFGEVSVLSIPSTILLTIPTTLTLITSVFALIIPTLGFLPRLFAGAMIDLSTVLSDRSMILLSMVSPVLLILLVLFTAMLIFFAVLKIKHVSAFLAIPLSMILIFGVSAGLAANNNKEVLTEDYRIEINDGIVFSFASHATKSSVAYLLRTDLRAVGATEIDHLILDEYNALEPYFLSKLATQVRVFALHLPQPKTDADLAIALRLEQEASLHRVYVIYDVSS